jgi:hypothetical protein
MPAAEIQRWRLPLESVLGGFTTAQEWQVGAVDQDCLTRGFQAQDGGSYPSPDHNTFSLNVTCSQCQPAD